MLDFRSPFLALPASPTTNPKNPFGDPVPEPSVYTAHIASLATNATVSADSSPERLTLMLAIIGLGFERDGIFGEEAELFPIKRIEGGALGVDKRYPKIFVFHGRQDSLIPMAGTEKFQLVIREKGLEADKDGKGKVLIRLVDGEHGFDIAPDITPATPWLKEGLDFVGEEWLR
jgi:hypothetical protein